MMFGRAHCCANTAGAAVSKNIRKEQSSSVSMSVHGDEVVVVAVVEMVIVIGSIGSIGSIGTGITSANGFFAGFPNGC